MRAWQAAARPCPGLPNAGQQAGTVAVTESRPSRDRASGCGRQSALHPGTNWSAPVR